jgi:hypothetical protein
MSENIATLPDVALQLGNIAVDFENSVIDTVKYIKGSTSLSELIADYTKLDIDLANLKNTVDELNTPQAKFIAKILTGLSVISDLNDIKNKFNDLNEHQADPSFNRNPDNYAIVSDVLDLTGTAASFIPALEGVAFGLKLLSWGFGQAAVDPHLPSSSESSPQNPQSPTVTTTGPQSGNTLGAGTITQPGGAQDNYQSGANGLLSGDSWTAADQTSGTDTFNPDGSSTSKITYANGAYATVVDDGRGNITTDYFTQNGIETRSTWVHSDGDSGSVTVYGDGLADDGSGSEFSVPQSASLIHQNPDGSYSTDNWNDKSEDVTIRYDANGNQTGQTNQSATATNDLTVNHSGAPTYIASEGIENTNDYNAEGGWIGGSWYSANSDGSANPAGIYESWAQINATKGTHTINASGVNVWDDTALDGSTWRDTEDLQGRTFSHLDVAGELLSDRWSDTDSVSGTDTFNGDGSGSGTFSNANGSGGSVALDTQGNITITNTNVQGQTVSTDAWNATNGSYDITLFNGDGSKGADYDYLANGNVVVTDYAANGSVADQETEAAGLVIDPDGSSFGKVVNADGSYTVYYENASGDTTAWVYTGGRLTDTYHTTDNDVQNAGWSGTLSNDIPWTSNDNGYTLHYTDAQGTQWIEYTNADGQPTGADFISPNGGHGYVTYNPDGSTEQETYAADGSLTVDSKDAQGNVSQELFNINGTETSDAWNNIDGSRGGDTYNPNGSSSGESINADGSLSAYFDDGQGNKKTTYYNAQGIATSDSWTKADGSSGTDTFNADGSSSGTVTNTDGSYSTYTNDGQSNIATILYSSAGNKTGDSSSKSDGSSDSDSYNADGSYSNYVNDGGGNSVTTNYDTAGKEISDSWKKSNGTSGSDTFNADNSSSGITTNTDGSFDTYTNDGQGNVVTDVYSANGVLQSQTGGTPSVTVTAPDGSYTTSIVDGKGNGTLFEYDATGVLTGDAWTKSDGSSGSDIYNADGSSVNTSYDPNTGITGYKATDASGDWIDYQTSTDANGTYLQTWTASDGTSGETEQWANGNTLSEKTNADGSSNETTYDVSTKVTGYKTTDASGNWTDYQTSTDTNGTYLQTWTASDGTSGETEKWANGNTLSEKTNADGSSNETTYDASTGITDNKITDASGNWTDYQTSTDANGTYLQTWTASDGTSGTTEKWTNGNTLSEKTNADGSSNETTYDASAGDTVYTVTNADGSSQATTVNRIVGAVIHNSDGSTTQTITNGDGSSTVTTTDVLGNIEVQYYDASGDLNKRSKTLSVSTLEGVISSTYVFNASGALIGYSGENGIGEYGYIAAYDGQGNVTSSTRIYGDTEISYETDGTVITKSQGTTITSSPDGSSVTVNSDGQGNNKTSNYDANTGVNSDTWTDVDGSHGSDVTNSDGSGYSTAYNTDGSYSVTTYDAYNFGSPYYYSRDSQTNDYTSSGTLTGSTTTSIDDTGRTQTNNYDANGTLVSDTWYDMAGNSGSDTYNADGSYSVMVNGGVSNYDGAGNLMSISTTTYGVYGGSLTTTTNLAGQLISDNWIQPDGSYGSDTYNLDGSGTGTTTYANGNYSTSTFDAAGNRTTQNYNASGILLGYNQSNTDPTTGDITAEHYSPEGELTGHSVTAIDNTTGRLETNNYDVNGTLLSDTWRDTFGNSGSDTYNANGSYTSVSVDSGGEQLTSNHDTAGNLTSTIDIDWQGNSTTTNYDANGDVTDTSWIDVDGSYGTTIDNTDGSSSSTIYAADGSYSVATTDSSGNSQSTYYSVTGVMTRTDRAAAAGSSGYTIYNTDGSYVVGSTDDLGNTTTDSYSVGGVLLSQETDINGNDVKFTYNADGSYIEVFNNGGTGTEYGGGKTSEVFDAKGNILEEDDLWDSQGDGIFKDSIIKYQGDGSYTETDILMNTIGNPLNAVAPYGPEVVTQFDNSTNSYNTYEYSLATGNLILENTLVTAPDGVVTHTYESFYDDGAITEKDITVDEPDGSGSETDSYYGIDTNGASFLTDNYSDSWNTDGNGAFTEDYYAIDNNGISHLTEQDVGTYAADGSGTTNDYIVEGNGVTYLSSAATVTIDENGTKSTTELHYRAGGFTTSSEFSTLTTDGSTTDTYTDYASQSGVFRTIDNYSASSGITTNITIGTNGAYYAQYTYASGASIYYFATAQGAALGLYGEEVRYSNGITVVDESLSSSTLPYSSAPPQNPDIAPISFPASSYGSVVINGIIYIGLPGTSFYGTGNGADWVSEEDGFVAGTNSMDNQQAINIVASGSPSQSSLTVQSVDSQTSTIATSNSNNETYNADGSSASSSYDPSTGITDYKTTDASGNWIDYQISTDGNGTHLQTWTASDGTSGETETWANGNTLSEKTNADGSVVSSSYDPGTGVTDYKTTDASGNWVDYQTSTDANGIGIELYTYSSGSTYEYNKTYRYPSGASVSYVALSSGTYLMEVTPEGGTTQTYTLSSAPNLSITPTDPTIDDTNHAPTGAVTINGTATQGQTLTVTNTLADADGLGVISYQWYANGTAINGATSDTLVLTQAQVGQAITATASYTDGFGTAEAVTSAATTAVANINDAPTGVVTVNGTATQGQTLTVTNTLADADGLGPISYQWYANGTAINGATGNTFTLTQAQVGQAITATASYTDGFGTAESVSSAATAAVANVNDAPTGTVTITGTVAKGQVLTATNTLADADGLGTISYQWYANGTAISGATASTLTLTTAQASQSISVTASYTDGFGAHESVASVNTLSSATVSVGSGTNQITNTIAKTASSIDGNGNILLTSPISGLGSSVLTVTPSGSATLALGTNSLSFNGGLQSVAYASKFFNLGLASSVSGDTQAIRWNPTTGKAYLDLTSANGQLAETSLGTIASGDVLSVNGSTILLEDSTGQVLRTTVVRADGSTAIAVDNNSLNDGGNGNQIDGTNDNVSSFGSNLDVTVDDSVVADSGTGSHISGTNDNVTTYGTNTTVNVDGGTLLDSGIGNYLGGNNLQITAEGQSTDITASLSIISSSADNATINATDNSKVTLYGQNNVVNVTDSSVESSGDNLTLTGVNSTVIIDGGSGTLNLSDTNIAIAEGSFDIVGENNTIDAAAGAAVQVDPTVSNLVVNTVSNQSITIGNGGIQVSGSSGIVYGGDTDLITINADGSQSIVVKNVSGQTIQTAQFGTDGAFSNVFLDPASGQTSATLTDFAAGGSQEAFFSNLPSGYASVTESFTGTNASGSLATASVTDTSGNVFDFVYNYDGNGLETSFHETGYDASGTLIGSGDFNPNGVALSGSVNQLIQAMASFSPTAVAQSSVIAANNANNPLLLAAAH